MPPFFPSIFKRRRSDVEHKTTITNGSTNGGDDASNAKFSTTQSRSSVLQQTTCGDCCVSPLSAQRLRSQQHPQPNHLVRRFMNLSSPPPSLDDLRRRYECNAVLSNSNDGDSVNSSKKPARLQVPVMVLHEQSLHRRVGPGEGTSNASSGRHRSCSSGGSERDFDSDEFAHVHPTSAGNASSTSTSAQGEGEDSENEETSKNDSSDEGELRGSGYGPQVFCSFKLGSSSTTGNGVGRVGSSVSNYSDVVVTGTSATKPGVTGKWVSVELVEDAQRNKRRNILAPTKPSPSKQQQPQQKPRRHSTNSTTTSPVKLANSGSAEPLHSTETRSAVVSHSKNKRSIGKNAGAIAKANHDNIRSNENRQDKDDNIEVETDSEFGDDDNDDGAETGKIFLRRVQPHNDEADNSDDDVAGSDDSDVPEVEVIRLNELFYTSTELEQWRRMQLSHVPNFVATPMLTRDGTSGGDFSEVRMSGYTTHTGSSTSEFEPMLATPAERREGLGGREGQVQVTITTASHGAPIALQVPEQKRTIVVPTLPKGPRPAERRPAAHPMARQLSPDAIDWESFLD